MESNHAWAKRCALYPCRARHPRLARRSSQTASTYQSSILKTQSKNLYESGDAWSRTTLALISYAFCALSVPRPASPFVKAIFTDSLNILSNTNRVKVKDEKNLSFPRLGSSCSFIITNKKICNHNPISVIPRQAVCRRSAGVWQTTQTGAHQCATAPRLQPLSR